MAEGALHAPLEPPGQHVGGDRGPGEPAEAAVVPNRPLEGDAEGRVPEAVARHGQRQQGDGQRGEVAQHAGAHLQGGVGVGRQDQVTGPLGGALGDDSIGKILNLASRIPT